MIDFQGILTGENRNRALAFAAIFVATTVILFGIRFSGGGELLAIAQGKAITDIAFTRANTQYVWDSPLFVLVLKTLPASVVVIALFFTFLAILPLSGLAARQQQLFGATATALFLTPALKVSLLNIGVGDGLVIMLVIIIVGVRNPAVRALCFFLVCSWHPQQSFFIIMSYCAALYAFRGAVGRTDFAPVAIGASLGLTVYVIHRSLLGLEFSDRAAFISYVIDAHLVSNLAWFAFSLGPFAIWYALIGRKAVVGPLVLLTWVGVCYLIANLTTDVTRVFTVITLPIILIGTAKALIQTDPVSNDRLTGAIASIFLFAPLSWAGLDYFVWENLIMDFCKWGFFCVSNT